MDYNLNTNHKKERFLRLSIVLLAILMLNATGTWLVNLVDFQLFPRHDSMLNAALLLSVVLYIFVMATPFMPGIEIGLAVMMVFGSKSALLIYLCTLVSLSISYAAGRLFPLQPVHQFLKWLHLHRANELLHQLAPLDQSARLELLCGKSPARLTPFLIKHRYVAIAVVLNLPGNALIGGGGGIGLIAGMSKLVPFHRYLLVIAVAVAPVPLFIYLQGG